MWMRRSRCASPAWRGSSRRWPARRAALLFGLGLHVLTPGARADESGPIANDLPRCASVAPVDGWWQALRGRSVELILRDQTRAAGRIIAVTPTNVVQKAMDGGNIRAFLRSDVARVRPIGSPVEEPVEPAPVEAVVPVSDWMALRGQWIRMVLRGGFPLEGKAVSVTDVGAVLWRPGIDQACAIERADVTRVERPRWLHLWERFRDRQVVVLRHHGAGLTGRLVDGTGMTMVLAPSGGGELIRVPGEEVVNITTIPDRTWGGPLVRIGLVDGARCVGRLTGFSLESIEVMDFGTQPASYEFAHTEVAQIDFGPPRVRVALVVAGPEASAEKLDACWARLRALGVNLDERAPVRLIVSPGAAGAISVETDARGVVLRAPHDRGPMVELCEDALFAAADALAAARSLDAAASNAPPDAVAAREHLLLHNAFRRPSPPPPRPSASERRIGIATGVTVGVILGVGVTVGLGFAFANFGPVGISR